MKFKPSHYAQIIAAFVIFTGLVFIAFAGISNSSSGNSGYGMLVYFSLFLILIAGAFLFYLANKNTSGKPDSEKDTDTEERHDENQETEAQNQINETPGDTAGLFEPKTFLPKEKNNAAQFSEELLKNLSGRYRIVQALFYARRPGEDLFSCISQFAYYAENRPADFKTGETLPGQAVKNKSIVTLSNLPDRYMTVASGLGKSSPGYLTFVPIKHNDEVWGLIEFATFTPLTDTEHQQLMQLSEKTGEIIVKLLKK